MTLPATLNTEASHRTDVGLATTSPMEDRKVQSSVSDPPMPKPETRLRNPSLNQLRPRRTDRRAVMGEYVPGDTQETSLSRVWPAFHPDSRLFRSIIPGQSQPYAAHTASNTTEAHRPRPHTP